MFRLLAKLASSVLVPLVLVGVSSALALAVVPLKERATGTLTDVAPGSLTFAGEGNASHFGRFSEVGSANFDDVGNVSNGHFTTTTRDGATISGTFSGTYTPLPTGKIRFDLNVAYLSGTGRLAGVTGQADVVAELDGVAPGAALEYEGIGSLVLP